jgi:5-methylcytosine-specific restriction endonuclease McrA
MPFDMAAYKRAWRNARKRAEICYDCGKPVTGFSKCDVCRAKEARVNLPKILVARKRKRDNASYRRKDAERRAAGVCLSCGGPRDTECVRCQSCNERSNRNQKRRYARQAGNGLCYFCGQPAEGRVICRGCYESSYRRADPLKMTLKDQRRRARLKGGGTLLPEHWLALVAFCENTCLRCLAKEPEVKITIDHVAPIVHGGPNTIQNVQPLCSRCNKSKNARTIDFRTPAVKAFVAETFGLMDG